MLPHGVPLTLDPTICIVKTFLHLTPSRLFVVRRYSSGTSNGNAVTLPRVAFSSWLKCIPIWCGRMRLDVRASSLVVRTVDSEEYKIWNCTEREDVGVNMDAKDCSICERHHLIPITIFSCIHPTPGGSSRRSTRAIRCGLKAADPRSLFP